jgi:hypothetical protein
VLLHLPRFCLTNQPYHLLHQENNLPYGFVKMGLFLLQLDITTIEKKKMYHIKQMKCSFLKIIYMHRWGMYI